MLYCAWLRRLLCRKLLTLVLVTYILTILLFFFNVDFTEPPTKTEESFSLIFPEAVLYSKRSAGADIVNTSSRKHGNSILNPHLEFKNSISDDNNVEPVYRPLEHMGGQVFGQEPVPLLEPMHDKNIRNKQSGDFISFGHGAYVYSAFLDDRKEQTFVRIMALMSQKAAKQFFYCYFNEVSNILPVKSEIYQLCENHNKMYGGYFYSCQVPDVIKHLRNLTFIIISSTETGPRLKVPVLSVRPPDHKLVYLDAYPHRPYTRYNIENKNEKVPSVQEGTSRSSTNSASPSQPSLSFAICVSPLFGNISFHRVVEFIELSRLLGVGHFIFYNHSIPPQVSDALRYYISRNIVSVLPWSLPKEIDSVWYYGQLLANNDCLYRTMPHFDLVSFNDIDEFIVPHSNASTWQDVFSSMLTADRCGFSFQSAFYDPGIREPFESTLLTPVLTAKSEMYSKVRTKVMLCPWRVFEVGIHHISKQNREDWRSWGVDPSVAYLHHYRKCVANFGMRCSLWEKDLIIADRYLNDLRENYETVVNHLLNPHQRPRLNPHQRPRHSTARPKFKSHGEY